jgi:hypothetical protein
MGSALPIIPFLGFLLRSLVILASASTSLSPAWRENG